MRRDFLSLRDWSHEDLLKIITLGMGLKKEYQQNRARNSLAHKTLAMIFAKPSSRTRVSFEVGMFQLGGHTIFLPNDELRPGKREAVSDLARVLSGYADGILIRTFSHDLIEEFACYSSAPVINGLTDKCHPCQALSDIFTIYEKLGRREEITLSYIGDGNNMFYSLLYGCAKLGINLNFACPPGYRLAKEIIVDAQQLNAKISIKQFDVPGEAVKGADVVYTDVWTSMGQEAEKEQRLRDFAGFQINKELLENARDNCLVMHCLPAHRGEEISAEVIDGPNSIVFEQAHNRLHVQKAILLELL